MGGTGVGVGTGVPVAVGTASVADGNAVGVGSIDAGGLSFLSHRAITIAAVTVTTSAAMRPS